MLKVALLAASIAISCCLSLNAQELSKADEEALEGTDELVASFAQCAGFWTWLSEFTRRDGKPAAADYLKTYANGAKTSALWVLATRYALEQPDAEPRTYGSFDNLVEGRIEVERLRLTALEEMEDYDAILAGHGKCEALTTGSEDILQLMRQELATP